MPTRKRLLFVDDEKYLLMGLRRTLASHRAEWDMQFVESGEAALEQLRAGQFDVIVSDMRMPGMTGADLLRTVATEFPTIARIILSGQASESDLLISVEHAHQYLAKPCERETLEDAIHRVVDSRHPIEDSDLLDTVVSLNALPTIPAVTTAVFEEVQGEEASTDAVGEIVSRDVALTAKVLHLANSSFLGFEGSVSDPREAVRLLGVSRLTALSFGTGLITEVPDLRDGFRFDLLHDRSVVIAERTELIASDLGADAAEARRAFVIGLMCSVGSFVLASQHTERYLNVASPSTQIASESALVKEFGATSSKVGARLLELWGLPRSIVETVAFHREPSGLDSPNPVIEMSAAHIATALVEAEASETDPVFDAEFLRSIGQLDRFERYVQEQPRGVA